MKNNTKLSELKLIVLGLIGLAFVSSCALPAVNEPVTGDVFVATSTFQQILPTETNAAQISTAISTITAIPTKTQTPLPTQFFTATPNPYITPTKEMTSQLPADYNPLTGEFVIYPENLLRSPLMVKVSNYPREIRPQAGLSKADIVFEYYIGSSMNRFLAVFYGENAEWAGPIRSGRLIDGQLAVNYHSTLVYGGADDRINTIITNPEVLGDRAVDTRYYDQCPPLCGEDTHSLEGLYVDTAKMSEGLISEGIDQKVKSTSLESTVFSETVPKGSDITAKQEIGITFSAVCSSKWTYDAASQSYFRWEEEGDGSPNYVETRDLLVPDGQLQVENVIILFSDYVVYDALMHDVRIHYADGPMPAIFFRNGVMVNGFWSGLDYNAPLVFTTEDGEIYPLAPGKSWIIFINEGSSMNTISEESIHFEFLIP